MSPTGAAGLDPQRATASITIEGGNDPHGVFSFAESSLNYTTEETAGVRELRVDRKFGSIGKW